MYIRLSPYNIDVAASTVSLYMYSLCGTDAFEKASVLEICGFRNMAGGGDGDDAALPPLP